MSKRTSEDRHRPAGPEQVSSSEPSSGRVEALFRHGLEAARVGQRARARSYFRAVLELDPAHEGAWLWQAGLTDDPQESLACLARVLSINPGNARARKGIRWARRRLAEQKAQSSMPPPVPPSVPPQRRSDGFRRWLALAFCLALLALALIAFLGHPEAPQMALAIFQPTATSTATTTPTATPTATSTATFTPTPTNTPIATPTNTPTPGPYSGKWIEIDLTNQTLVAYEGRKAVYRAIVSTGLPRTPTVTGQYRIYQKFRYKDMSGPGYYLRNVPYIMYFYASYGIHGTYWHNNFGQPMSHGCVNMKTADAAWLFNWATPVLPSGRNSVKASADNPGTWVMIH